MSDGQSLDRPLGLLLDLLQCIHVMLLLGSPELDSALQVWLYQCQQRGRVTSLRVTFGSILHYTAQDGIGLRGRVFWLMFNLLTIRTARSLSAKLLSDWLAPSLYCCIGFFPGTRTSSECIFSSIQVGNSVFQFPNKILKYVSKRYALILLYYICKGFIHSHKHVLLTDEILRWGVWSNSYVPNAIKNKQKIKISIAVFKHGYKYTHYKICLFCFFFFF